jgi:pyruvate dehydrogenase (quinone)
VRSTIEALLPLLQQKQDRRFLDELVSGREKAYDRLDRRAIQARGPIRPQHVTEVVARLAAPDAVWSADGGSPMVWLLRHVPATGRNRTLMSLTHGTMANAMPQALGASAAFPGRQVISLSGDGGLTMLMGDLLTAVQEKLPIKVLVYNNSSLAFVELEQKVEGLLDSYTKLQNPDFGRVAEAIGFWGRRVEDASEVELAVAAWLAADGPALLDVVVDPLELVMPPHVEAEQVYGAALYSARAVLAGRGGDVAALIEHNFVQ